MSGDGNKKGLVEKERKVDSNWKGESGKKLYSEVYGEIWRESMMMRNGRSIKGIDETEHWEN